MSEVETHPVQVSTRSRFPSRCPKVVTMRAYEVYAAVCGEQQALVEGECRGGFGVNELIAFLYAASFPQSEWRQRVDEAFAGMENL